MNYYGTVCETDCRNAMEFSRYPGTATQLSGQGICGNVRNHIHWPKHPQVVDPGTSHPHVSLPAQPLLACTAVLDVLEDLGEHGTLQTLLLPCLL